MFPHVPCQLVGTGELPPAVFPVANIGLLPSVGPQVSLQVAGLGVALAATWMVACVVRQLSLQLLSVSVTNATHETTRIWSS